MVKTFQAYLPDCHRTYSCIHCRAHLANHDELISKSFQGSQGRAYLFNSVVNVGCGPAEERILLTGLHAVADIYCECCKTTLGWKYEHAFESSQKYKEGKYIIEMAHMIKENGWESPPKKWTPIVFLSISLSLCLSRHAFLSSNSLCFSLSTLLYLLIPTQPHQNSLSLFFNPISKSLTFFRTICCWYCQRMFTVTATNVITQLWPQRRWIKLYSRLS